MKRRFVLLAVILSIAGAEQLVSPPFSAAHTGMELPQLNHIGSSNPSSCDFKYGPIDFYTPITKLPRLFAIRYNSGTGPGVAGLGWNLDQPHVIDLNGALKFYDGTYKTTLHLDGVGSYHDRTGRRIKKTGVSSYSLLRDDGTEIVFSAVDQVSSSEWRYLPSSISNRGWRSDYTYSTVGTRKYLTSVSADAHSSGLEPSYTIQLTYTAGSGSYVRLLSQIKVVANATTLSTSAFDYSVSDSGEKLLESVTRLGVHAAFNDLTQFGYYPNTGDLNSIRNQTGGLTTVSYSPAKITGEIGGNKLIVNKVILNSGTQSYETRYRCERGTYARGETVFERVTVTEPDGSKTEQNFRSGLGSLGGNGDPALRALRYHTKRTGAAGAILSQKYEKLQLGGDQLVAPTVIVFEKYGPNGGTPIYLASAIDVNFGYGKSLRPEKVTNYGQIDGFNPDSFLISDTEHAADTNTLHLQYVDSVSAGVFNQVSTLSERSVNNTLTKEISTTYDSAGNPDIVKEWVDETNSYLESDLDIDSLGNLIRLTNGQRSVNFTYDRFLTKTIEPGLGHLTTIIRNPVTLQIERVIDPAGVTTKYEYDYLQRVKKISRLGGNLERVLYTLDEVQLNGIENGPAANGVSSSVAGIPSRAFLDGFGQILQTRTLFDGTENQYAVRDFDRTASSSRQTKAYLSAGDEYESTPAFGVSNNFVDGTLRSIVPDVSGNGLGTWNVFPEAAGTALISPLGNLRGVYSDSNVSSSLIGNGNEQMKTDKEWNGDALRSTFSDLANNIFPYDYDSVRRLRKVFKPGSTQATLKVYEYNSNGDLWKASNASGETITYLYDLLGRLVTESAGASTIEYSYDNSIHPDLTVMNGKLARIKNLNGEVHFGWNGVGELTDLVEEVYGFGERRFKFIRGTKGEILEILYPNNASVQYQYDDQLRIKSINSAFLPAAFQGDLLMLVTSRSADGAISDFALGNGISGVVEQYQNGFVKSYRTTTLASVQLSKWEYEYNPDSTVKSVRRIQGAEDILDQYEFDSRELVDSVLRNSTLYDFAFNNQGLPTQDPSLGWSNIAYENAANPYAPSRLTTSQGVNYSPTYDANNRLKTFKGVTYSYNAWGQMTAALGSTVNVELAPGPLGNYSHVIDSGTHELSFGANLYRERIINGATTQFIYVPGESIKTPEIESGQFIAELRWNPGDAVALTSGGGGSHGPGTGPPARREGPEATPSPSPTTTPPPTPTVTPTPTPTPQLPPPSSGTYVQIGGTQIDEAGNGTTSPNNPTSPNDCKGNNVGDRAYGSGTIAAIGPCGDPCVREAYFVPPADGWDSAWSWLRHPLNNTGTMVGSWMDDRNQFAEDIGNITGAGPASDIICDMLDNGITLDNAGDAALAAATGWGIGKAVGWVARTPLVTGLGNRIGGTGRRMCEILAARGSARFAPADPRVQTVINRLRDRGIRVKVDPNLPRVVRDGGDGLTMAYFYRPNETIYVGPTTDLPTLIHEYLHYVQFRSVTDSKFWFQRFHERCIRKTWGSTLGHEMHNLSFMERHAGMLQKAFGLDEIDQNLYRFFIDDYARLLGFEKVLNPFD